jgi:ADP-ribose pyrophosphatase YjhB (NUDIX family)
MSSEQPIVITAGPNPRQFATSAVAIQAIIVNQYRQILLLSSPTRNQGWQVVSGALEAGETLLAGTLREVHEEIGIDIKVRPLGTVHIQTFHYDEQVQYMLSSYYLFAYQGGRILPGDDMIGSECRWWSMTEIEAEGEDFHVSTKPWMLKRAIELYDLWAKEDDLPLQQSL